MHLWSRTDHKCGCIELDSYYNFYLWITWATWVISPISSLFSCLWDGNNSYFRYFESHREKAKQIMYFLENAIMAERAPLYVYRKWQATVLALHILCLCHLPNVLSTAGRIPNRCFLLLIFFIFFFYYTIHKCSCQRPTSQNFSWNGCFTVQVQSGMIKVYAPLLRCLKKQGCYLNLGKWGVKSLKTRSWKGNCIP